MELGTTRVLKDTITGFTRIFPTCLLEELGILHCGSREHVDTMEVSRGVEVMDRLQCGRTDTRLRWSVELLPS
jgi:hypothetical protein